MDKEEDVEKHFSRDDLRDLFQLNEDTISDTHDKYVLKLEENVHLESDSIL